MPPTNHHNNIEEGLRRTREGLFSRIAHLFQRDGYADEIWEHLEEALISADVGIPIATSLIKQAQEQLRSIKSKPDSLLALNILKSELLALLEKREPQIDDILSNTGSAINPTVVLMVGVNGSGKTTCVAKLACLFQKAGKHVILGAADTYRAGAIDQLRIWASRLGIEIVAHKPGADSAAVAFDTMEAGIARGANVVIIDTAGRLHTKTNLMEELRKIRRVLGRLDHSSPHLTLLVMDATTGQNGISQARAFKESVYCDGVFLTKLDGTSKGGVVLAIQRELDLPVLFIGTGESTTDLSFFNPAEFVEALFTPVTAVSNI